MVLREESKSLFVTPSFNKHLLGPTSTQPYDSTEDIALNKTDVVSVFMEFPF